MSNQSFIVGDAGGTSTQWRVVENGKIHQFETIGFNAYTHNIDDLKFSIKQTLGEKITKDTPTYFYAAGVDTKQQAQKVTTDLSEIFGDNMYVDNDLVGVARSLCGREAGNVCIIGTGSNACYYDGINVNKVSASLGYVLGDEGSGAFLGKKLMMGVFREQFSKDIIDAFQNEFGLTSHEVIQRIYHQPRPNHFLASFSHFIHQHRNHPEIYKMIEGAFVSFFEAFFFKNPHKDEPYYFSGSIAYYFSDILRQVGNDQGFLIKNIVQSPISGLVLYHQQYD
ncbi:N-acetylglucosamine kinase [Ekhidna sp.]|uniref:N-acetylglucosamine kinase n=1 Tax=Ekhidna sp. TaxID=2608089 RepID=UPI003511225A